MVMLELTLTLPDDVAREAEALGLLTPQALQQLIDAEVARRRKLERLFTTLDQLAEVAMPPLSTEELNAEIKAVRAEQSNRCAGRA
ncbi:MAG: hypothetical protein EOM24_18975 [Chloroflexia bacterium]|nr:hypothetical protein [Chloroflexia bacterium]